MNDEIERINAQNKAFDERKSEGDFSQAKNSSITHPEEDEKKKKMAEGIIAELSNHREEIDAIKQLIGIQSEQINKLTIAISQLAQGGQVTMDPNQKGLNMEAISQLGDLVEKGISAYKSLKGTPAAPSFIDPEYINEQVKASVMGNFEIGNALISNLKSKLINKAVTASVTDALKETHEPK